MAGMVGRRELLAGTGAALIVGALGGCGGNPVAAPDRRAEAVRGTTPRLELAPLRASTDRITRITVCTRPFRAQGPRIEVEQVGQKTVVHNYGHGGSGWSLSWGSGAIAVKHALATGEREIGVIGCGALGLTSALLAQRAGLRVTIYAKELPPDVRSSLATGIWSPDSRICFDEFATPAFRKSWEAMARESFKTYQTLLGLPGNPVEFIDIYGVSAPNVVGHRSNGDGDGRPQFAELQSELLADLIPARAEFGPGSHPLGNRTLRRLSLMMFNLTAYSRLLMTDFLDYGGRIEIREFHAPAQFAELRAKTLIHATGYGARALFGDRSITPVRGQLARAIPQPDIDYGLFYNGVSFIPRRDGLVFQVVGENDYYGFDNDDVTPDRAEAERAVNTIASLYT